VGPAVSEKRVGGTVPVWGAAMLGRGLVLAVGWKGSPDPFPLFYFFSIFLFYFSFVIFAKQFQFDLKQLLTFANYFPLFV
jgi:hypothetical protein